MQAPEKLKTAEENIVEEMPNSWWYRVYFAVIIYTIFVISILGIFSWYFSK